MSVKRAIILAGGLGKRLHPYTVVLPKPLMPIGDAPILEIIIKQLSTFGFERITIAVNHQADIIKAFEDGKKWGVNIDYSLEKKQLGTMGPLSIIKDLPENFLIMNGDILSDINYDIFYKFHCDGNFNFTVSSKIRIDTLDYGILTKGREGFLENLKKNQNLTI